MAARNEKNELLYILRVSQNILSQESSHANAEDASRAKKGEEEDTFLAATIEAQLNSVSSAIIAINKIDESDSELTNKLTNISAKLVGPYNTMALAYLIPSEDTKKLNEVIETLLSACERRSNEDALSAYKEAESIAYRSPTPITADDDIVTKKNEPSPVTVIHRTPSTVTADPDRTSTTPAWRANTTDGTGMRSPSSTIETSAEHETTPTGGRKSR